MNRRQQTIEQEKAHHMQTYGRQPLVLERGEGTRVWDVDGSEYLDALGGIAVNVLGHCHPAVTKAIQEQSAKLLHVSNLYYTPIQSDLVAQLTRLAGFDRAFLCNSGTEAVEGAVKLARRQASIQGRGPQIVALEGCFHGRTLATLALGSEKYQRGFGPMPEGFRRIPRDDLDALDAAIGMDTAALILEPIQGEGGIHEIPSSYLAAARRLSQERGVLLIFDEIQCGMGRSGKFFAWQNHGIRPDIVTTAKGLGGGVPIGAFLADDALAAVLGGGDHGTTFGGNPLACAAALATLRTIEDGGLAQRAGKLGDEALRILRDHAAGNPKVREVRGRGLMIGVELEDSIDGARVVDRMREKGVLANCTAGRVLRLLPPLTIEEADLETALQVLMQSIDEVGSDE
jgi:acetylornithine/N-succinyldiaminopimelate aminotransferase